MPTWHIQPTLVDTKAEIVCIWADLAEFSIEFDRFETLAKNYKHTPPSLKPTTKFTISIKELQIGYLLANGSLQLIAGTSLTYFIFIFQLKFSERSDSCYPPVQEMASKPGLANLSDNINFYLSFLGIVITHFIIRVNSIVSWRQTLRLIEEAKALLGRYKSIQIPKIVNLCPYVALAVTFSALEVVAGFYMVLKYYIIEGPYPSEYYLFLSRNGTVYKSFGVIFEAVSTLALAYIIIYIFCLGAVLIQVHANMLSGFQQQFIDPHFKIFEQTYKHCSKTTKLTSWHIQPTLVGTKAEVVRVWADQTEFSVEFGRLTQCFDMYIQIVGPYLLAIAFQSSLYAIKFLSSMSSFISNNKYDDVNGTIAIAALHTSVLLLVASFGNVFKQQVIGVISDKEILHRAVS
ncbi:unnamed protein product [Allacma fusca]|uniref:Uncharacterized protein n=1 Tax=Allacma fusca TaxID=39272 RepID=A0A8J2NUJ8_9HEXA|nr:unnamed protein product [Allacma fusca]